MAQIHNRKVLARRTLLRGAGVSLALPFLDAMMPRSLGLYGEESKTIAELPKRFAACYLPAGVCNEQWYPKKTGKGLELSASLKPLEKLKKQLTVVSGLRHPNGIGHHKCQPCFLNGRNYNTDPGISLDQHIAKAFGKETRYPSLQWGNQGGMGPVAYTEDGVGIPAVKSPDAIFNRLFVPDDAQSKEKARRRLQQRKSVLDGVRDEARSMQKGLGTADRERMEQYFFAVREVEGLVTQAESFIDKPKPTADRAILENQYTLDAAYTRCLFDLLYLALSTDSSRVITYIIDNEGTSAKFPHIGVAHRHALTHHGGDEKMLKLLAKSDHFYVQELARFGAKMAAQKEGDGNLLDRSIIFLGSGLNNGDGFANGTGSHRNDKMAALTLGGTSLGVHGNQHIKIDDGSVPMCNLYLSILQAYGFQDASFSDSTGPLKGFLA